jgi:hypothetical protein
MNCWIKAFLVFCGICSIAGTQANSDANTSKYVCDYGIPEFFVMELVEALENQSRFSARELAEKLVLDQCQREIDKGNKDLNISRGKIRFFQFSDSYDVYDDFYFCKNKTGYKAYLSSVTSKFQLFSREKERALREEKHKANLKKLKKQYPNGIKKTKKFSKDFVDTPKENLWSCAKPNYIKIHKIVTEEQKKILIQAYGEKICTKVD